MLWKMIKQQAFYGVISNYKILHAIEKQLVMTESSKSKFFVLGI